MVQSAWTSHRPPLGQPFESFLQASQGGFCSSRKPPSPSAFQRSTLFSFKPDQAFNAGAALDQGEIGVGGNEKRGKWGMGVPITTKSLQYHSITLNYDRLILPTLESVLRYKPCSVMLTAQLTRARSSMFCVCLLTP